MATHELVAFADRLNRSGLLDAVRLDQVNRQLLPASADAEALARQLIARRWLSVPQARDLLAGRVPLRRVAATTGSSGSGWVWVVAVVLLMVVGAAGGIFLLVQHLRETPAEPESQQAGAGSHKTTNTTPDATDKLRRLTSGDQETPHPSVKATPTPPGPKVDTTPPIKTGPTSPSEPLPAPEPPKARNLVPVATYLFNDTLAAEETGVPALIPTDPLRGNGFETTTVFGRTQRVYDFVGNANPVEQAGLTFDNSGGLLPNNNYSIEMVVELLQTDNAWRRLVDVEDRQSDDGFYVDPANHLQIYPLAGTGASLTSGAFRHIVLTVSDTGIVKAYMDGECQFTGATQLMTISNQRNVVHFFLDNVVGPGQGEFSNGKIGLLRLYKGVLSEADVVDLAKAFGGRQAAPPADPPVKNVAPDPGTMANFPGTVGQVCFFQVTGAAAGSVWGTDIYTSDSALAAAAVHAGVLRVGETGVVRVQIVAGLSAYTGSTRNGVSSASWNAYPASYTISRVAGRPR